ncbi:hypothetical protein BurJ1DRAFT_2565 [Burkholderiales bacterium JOSHI_001]|nr:hypothetical protein BurJ1DRAFT_2565 [Burkholderiales bacterium JOSHI_001]
MAKPAPRKEQEPRSKGRPRLQEGEETIPVTIRMTRPQRDKLARLGGPPWVRSKIDKAKDPAE